MDVPMSHTRNKSYRTNEIMQYNSTGKLLSPARVKYLKTEASAKSLHPQTVKRDPYMRFSLDTRPISSAAS